MILRYLVAIVAVAGVAILAACGGDDDSDSGASATPAGTPTEDASVLGHPCSLITPQEVSEIMGLTFLPTNANDNPCILAADVSSIEISSTNQGDNAAEDFEQLAQIFVADELPDPPGDRAIWIRGFLTLNVLVGHYIFEIKVPDVAGDNERDQAIAIALALLD